MWFKKENKLNILIPSGRVSLENPAEYTADTTAYPTRSHLQILTHDHISKSDQHCVIVMITQNFHITKLGNIRPR